HGTHLDLPSFPTRRSSDLGAVAVDLTVEVLLEVDATALHLLVERLRERLRVRVAHVDGVAGQGDAEVVALQSESSGSVALLAGRDRKSTRLNSSHVKISYA